MKQKQYSPLSIGEMAMSLYAANEGFLDDVDVAKVVDFEEALHDFARSNHGDLIQKINDTGAYSDEILDGLKAVLEGFKANGVW